MGISITTETDTVIKKIIPYLNRRGYDVTVDIDFEVQTKRDERYTKGYVDLLLTCGKTKPVFLIEAKRSTKRLTDADKKQALTYGRGHKVPFVVVTNGTAIQCFNTKTGEPIRWNGTLSEKIPTREQLDIVLRALKANPSAQDVSLGTDETLPFRPGLPLKQLNALFARSHNAIRKIEKNEENAFQDFSKLLFLKLLEEKADADSSFHLPYSYRFHELAERSDSAADQVKDAVDKMIKQICNKTAYGDVLADPIHLRNAKTYMYIVRQLSSVSFYDSSLDSKGAAFEYYVRATLKGKKLGQYFTPRPLVQLMSVLVGRNKIATSLLSGSAIKVLDPACGTGGFLVYLMQDSQSRIEERFRKNEITEAAKKKLLKRLHTETFFGGDANDGVASAAKMNMIIAGDGHTNIQPGDTLAKGSSIWTVADDPTDADCDLIVTNPPFGTSETETLTAKDWAQFPIGTKKGQYLFLQKMVGSVKDGADICTVIDEGVLNTDTGTDLRKWILQKCELRAVVLLPDVTFKPNKINVRSSVLLLRRRKVDDVDLDKKYDVRFIRLSSLGYQGSGELVRGFDLSRLFDEIETWMNAPASVHNGYQWSGFSVPSNDIAADTSHRFDLKYWDRTVKDAIDNLAAAKHPTVKSLNQIKTKRGKSPPAEMYVDKADGYALVVKAGTNISKFGELLEAGDYVEKNVFDELAANKLVDGDILIASTGTGTLGKSCVFRSTLPAIPDGHVTVIRVDKKKIYPEYLCDYIRLGFGSIQVQRLFTGSTGLIELTPEQIDAVVIELPASIAKQKIISDELRKVESHYRLALTDAEQKLSETRKRLFSQDPGIVKIVEDAEVDAEADDT